MNKLARVAPPALVLSSAAVFSAALALGACNKPPEPQPDKAADKPMTTTSMASASPSGAATGAAMGAASGGAATAAGPDDIAYDAPATWVSAPNPSTMRKATFKIPKAGGDAEDAELAISAASGGVDPNIKRWEQQFGDAKAKTELRTVNGLKVTTVEIHGKIAAGGMMGMPATAAKDNQMLLGAVVDGGDRQFFFKMVGGEKTVSAAKKDFEKFVSSFRAK